ncbi:hypothetical protein B0H11DRAFT_1908550 [Mycena galericulata]|nr:hypothetical protein B0H11DRAFT_1908550 [Mycena galericulata]
MWRDRYEYKQLHPPYINLYIDWGNYYIRLLSGPNYLPDGTRLSEIATTCLAALEKMGPPVLSSNITPDLPEWQPLRPHQARFTISMHIAKAEDDGSIFQGPDTYSILLDIELQGQPRSPLIYIGRFVGSSEDGDAPMWTRFLKPRHMYSFVDPRSWAALLVCGMTDIHVESVSTSDISARMQAWAHTTALGTYVEQDVIEHCQCLKAVVEITSTPESPSESTVAPRRRLIRRALPMPRTPPKRTPGRALVRRVTPYPVKKQSSPYSGKENIDPRY